MFLCRGARSTGSVATKFRCNFEGTAEVGSNLRQHVTWTTCDNLRVHTRCINSYGLCRSAEMLDNFVKGNACTFSLTSGQTSRMQTARMFALKAVSSPCPMLTIFPRMSRDPKTLDKLSAYVFCCATGFRSSQNMIPRALSTAAKQKQFTGPKGEPAIVEQVLSTKRPQGENEESEPEKKPSKTTQLKKVFKEYGAVGVSFHIGISLISLGIFYIALSSGINMAAVLCKMGFNETVVQSKMAAGASTFVLAYAVHKLFAPLRISITLVSVPFIVRYLRKTGLFKSSPPSL